MPPFSLFKKADYFYSTLAHEAVHLTGHPSRCNRQLGNRFGSEAYAAEELIAELGSAFLSSELNLESEPRTDHAPYVANLCSQPHKFAYVVFRIMWPTAADLRRDV